jgi:hypothetical protein
VLWEFPHADTPLSPTQFTQNWGASLLLVSWKIFKFLKKKFKTGAYTFTYLLEGHTLA